MRILLRSTDIVLVSFVRSLMKDAGIDTFVLDDNIDMALGTPNIIPSRVMVASDRLSEARRIMRDADLGAELMSDKDSQAYDG